MQQFLIYFFIAVGLSMDAFSLALAYGTTNIAKNKMILLSIFVGIFHYFMPWLGSVVGNHFLEEFVTKSNFLVAIIFLILALEMFLSRKEERKGTITNFFSILLFALTVSIDSFSVGLALGITEKTIKIAFSIFAIVSATFTFLGLVLGKKLSDQFGTKATYLGIAILILLALKYLI